MNRPTQETIIISALATTHIEVIKITLDTIKIRSQMILAIANFFSEIGKIAMEYDKEFCENVLKPTLKAYKIIELKEPTESYKKLIETLK